MERHFNHNSTRISLFYLSGSWPLAHFLPTTGPRLYGFPRLQALVLEERVPHGFCASCVQEKTPPVHHTWFCLFYQVVSTLIFTTTSLTRKVQTAAAQIRGDLGHRWGIPRRGLSALAQLSVGCWLCPNATWGRRSTSKWWSKEV